MTHHTVKAGDIRNTKAIRHDLYCHSSTSDEQQRGKKTGKPRTSPQPYSRKCFEKSVDVLSTQWLARFTTGSSKISGTLSPSLSTFLSPEPQRERDKHHALA